MTKPTPIRGAALRNALVTIPTGETMPLVEACRLLDLDVHAVHGRIGAGWTPERAIAAPTNHKHARYVQRQITHKAPGFNEWRKANPDYLRPIPAVRNAD